MSTNVDEPARLEFQRTGADYFPAGTFDNFKMRWFSGHLAEMRESSFMDNGAFANDAEVYRFTWLSTFDGNLVVRVHIAPRSSPTVSAKRYDGGHSTGWRAGAKTYEGTRALAEKEGRELRTRLGSCDFRGMGALGPEELSGLDGSVWLFEWRTPEGQGVIARSSPNAMFENFSKEDCRQMFPDLDYEKHKTEYASFVQLCNAFRRASGLDVELY